MHTGRGLSAYPGIRPGNTGQPKAVSSGTEVSQDPSRARSQRSCPRSSGVLRPSSLFWHALQTARPGSHPRRAAARTGQRGTRSCARRASGSLNWKPSWPFTADRGTARQEAPRRYEGHRGDDRRGLPVQAATCHPGVSESGYYQWRGRLPSAWAVPHPWLTEQIQAVHELSRGTYSGPCVHAELTLGLHHRQARLRGKPDSAFNRSAQQFVERIGV
jgi:hypothetical protein